jgi:DUF4097 and DUF4098 domain-containing protein YvlB
VLKKVFLVAFLLIIIGSVGALFTAKSFFDESDLKETKVIANDQISTVTLESNYAGFELLESNKDSIIIETIGPKNVEKPIITTDGNTLKITSHVKIKPTIGINFRNNHHKIYVYLPKKQYENIIISNNVGSISAEDIQANTLSAKSKTGSIDLRNVTTDQTDANTEVGSIKIFDSIGTLHASSKTGSVNIQNNQSEHPITAKTAVGSIKVSDSEGSMNLASKTGSITVKAESIKQTLEAKTAVGSITIKTAQLPEDHTITANSNIGSTTIFGDDVGYLKRGNGTHALKLQSNTGSITIEQD